MIDRFHHLSRAIRAGFAFTFEPTIRGTFVIRYRAAVRDARYPATFRVRDHAIERENLEDCFAQVAQILSSELDMDDQERAARLAAMDQEDRDLVSSPKAAE
jgi:hypothetical protein